MPETASSSQTTLRSILSKSAWVSIYTGLYRLATLLVAVMSARLLDVTDYGKVSVLQATASLFIMFASVGLGTVAIKLVAEHGARYVKGLSWVNATLCGLASLVILLGATEIADWVYKDTTLTPLFALLAWYVFASGISQFQSSILAGEEEYRAIASVNLVVGLLSIAAVYVAVSRYGVIGWLWAMIALEGLKVIVFQLMIVKRFDLAESRFNVKDLRYIGQMAVPVALSGFLILPVNWYLNRELLLLSGYADVALLNIADQWIAILTFFPIAIGNAMLPIMSRMQGGQERNYVSNSALKINALFACVCAVITWLLGSVILSFYGQSYVEGAYLFAYLIPLVIVLAMTNQLNNRVVAEGRPALMVYGNLLWLACCLPVSLSLMALGWGLKAILLGRLTGYLAKLLMLARFMVHGEKK